MKRLFDIVLALTALMFLALPFLVIMVVLRFTGEGNVWYRQDRVGKHSKHFKVFKFVTMREDSETTGNKDITVRGDPRVLPVGRVLRMTKMNELPQVLNVLFGDMSIVGWRPLMPVGFAEYSDHVKENIVKQQPGITGIGSIVFRDEEAIITDAQTQGKDLRTTYREDIMPYKGAVELWYNENRSMLIDLKIIFITAYAILSPGNRLLQRWFPGLPEPESELVRKHAGFQSAEGAPANNA
jgi:lipopolysaccharide/colanic/teichoic acid biosynthesis glycosyltransferase